MSTMLQTPAFWKCIPFCFNRMYLLEWLSKAVILTIKGTLYVAVLPETSMDIGNNHQIGNKTKLLSKEKLWLH